MWRKPWARRTIKRWLTLVVSRRWKEESCLNKSAILSTIKVGVRKINLELLVPAPISPRERIARWESSLSGSCESLERVSIRVILGWERLRRASPSGTALFKVMSPYCRIWFMALNAISVPISSLDAIKAIPKTDTAWNSDSFSSTWSTHFWNNCWNLRTFPLPTYPHPIRVASMYFSKEK